MPYSNANKRPADDSNILAAAKRPKPNYDEIINVIVGGSEEQKQYAVHKSIICERSPFFKAVCSRLWQEGQERLVKLPEHDPTAFKVLLHWVYTDKFDWSPMMQDGCIRIHHFGQVWSLTHYTQCFILCNYVVESVLEEDFWNSEPWTHDIDLMTNWHEFPIGSNIRKLMIDLLASFASGAVYEAYFDLLPTDVVLEFLINSGHCETSAKQNSPI